VPYILYPLSDFDKRAVAELGHEHSSGDIIISWLCSHSSMVVCRFVRDAFIDIPCLQIIRIIVTWWAFSSNCYRSDSLCILHSKLQFELECRSKTKHSMSIFVILRKSHLKFLKLKRVPRQNSSMDLNNFFKSFIKIMNVYHGIRKKKRNYKINE